MAITAKPKKTSVIEKPESKEIDEKKAIAFINQGGSVASHTATSEAEEDEKQKGVIVRMYPDMIQEIDDLLKKLPKRNRPSRNAWILKAVEEKLKREKKNHK
ncbi:hypothetical protein Q0590_33875 [Rhodocytophaga aerolata]|uniref:Ribbon-helix-helix protein CopG domain-containing protein n=1 Tax=Rhodocytophaga aerolata TaxID=455078 RepID=A0ABT8RJB2_9BACT|nr:hypothetical protein [Rhodocytophaga aerolata]MDO1451313.1 hypothetical protein [Rhodocytophaga aerolata]